MVLTRIGFGKKRCEMNFGRIVAIEISDPETVKRSF